MTGVVPQNNNLWQGVNGVNNPCPNGFRLPTPAEWTSWVSAAGATNAAAAYNSNLKLALAGYRFGVIIAENAGTFFFRGGDGGWEWGTYWSSSIDGNISRYVVDKFRLVQHNFKLSSTCYTCPLHKRAIG
jgi:uncharacterized protein (TIGR02145 family)